MLLFSLSRKGGLQQERTTYAVLPLARLRRRRALHRYNGCVRVKALIRSRARLQSCSTTEHAVQHQVRSRRLAVVQL